MNHLTIYATSDTCSSISKNEEEEEEAEDEADGEAVVKYNVACSNP